MNFVFKNNKNDTFIINNNNKWVIIDNNIMYYMNH